MSCVQVQKAAAMNTGVPCRIKIANILKIYTLHNATNTFSSNVATVGDKMCVMEADQTTAEGMSKL